MGWWIYHRGVSCLMFYTVTSISFWAINELLSFFTNRMKIIDFSSSLRGRWIGLIWFWHRISAVHLCLLISSCPSLAGSSVKTSVAHCSKRQFFLQNAHFRGFYSISVFNVLQQTRAYKNFENRMNIKKVIDIHDYDSTLKVLVGYNKLVWSISARRIIWLAF